MSDREDGGPAFPFAGEDLDCEGMSLRDYFAAAAISSAVATYRHGRESDEKRPCVSFGYEDNSDATVVAEYAYAIAEAMLAARNI